jgi:hypothetical protein
VGGRDGAGDGYEAVDVPAQAGEPPADDAPQPAASGAGCDVMLRRRSVLASRRAVLYIHGQPDTFVPEDLVAWYTERGFHFYVMDLRPPDGLDKPDKPGRRRRGSGGGAGRVGAGRVGGEALGRLDAAGRHLRDAEGIDMVMVTAHGADALTAALWCAPRHQASQADALVLSSPVFGRNLPVGLDIACPVLVLSSGREPEGEPGRLAPWRRRKPGTAVRLGAHVTWLRIDGAPDSRGAATVAVAGVKADITDPGERDQDPGRDSAGDRRRFFDELGRWLGAYMYGSVRDQLL